MKNRLKGKSAIVTGATAGIGKATAQIFAKSGCNLILTGRRKQRLASLKKELIAEHESEIKISAFDIRDRDACENFVSTISKPVDILINNAGLAKGVDAVYEADLDDWDVMIDTNVKGLLTLTRLISKKMKVRNSGHIINIGSIAAHEAYSGGIVYCATKHAVKAITEATKKDLYGTKVRVSMVSPGLVETEFSEVRFNGNSERAEAVYENMKPLTGADIAEIVHFTANRPAHVNIMDTVVFPTAQSSATMVHRNDA